MSRTLLALLLVCSIAVINCGSIERLLEKNPEEPVVIVDTGDGGDERRPFNPFVYDGPMMPPTRTRFSVGGDWGFGSDFALRLNNMLAGLQSQFDNLWRRFYDRVDHTTFDGTKGQLPPTYKNTTSTQKVVNGSVITVNETIDKQSDNNSMSFFHVKVIHVRPENPLPPSVDEPTFEDVPTGPEGDLPPVIQPESPAGEPDVSRTPEREQLKPDRDDKTDVEDNMP